LASAARISPIDAAAAIASKFADAQENMQRRKFRSVTLGPGQAGHGFLYIPIPKKGDREKVHLTIPMLKSGSEEAVDLELVF